MNPFIPIAGATVNINVSAASQRVAIAARAGGSVRVHNDGTATVWFDFGGPGINAATASSISFPAGAIEVYTCPDVGAVINVAVIAAGATGKIYFTPGEGN